MALKRWKLIEARQKAKLSQEELAEELETTRVTISHWENGGTEPYPHFKRKLEERFGIDIEILLLITDETDEEVDENAEGLSGEERETGEALTASPAPASPSVTSCVWQPSTPLFQFIASNPARHFWQI